MKRFNSFNNNYNYGSSSNDNYNNNHFVDDNQVEHENYNMHKNTNRIKDNYNNNARQSEEEVAELHEKYNQNVGSRHNNIQAHGNLIEKKDQPNPFLIFRSEKNQEQEDPTVKLVAYYHHQPNSKYNKKNKNPM